MKENDELDMSLITNTDDLSARLKQAEAALQHTHEKLEALQNELAHARQEAEAAKEEVKRIILEKEGKELFAEESKYWRIIELERLEKQVLEKNALKESTLESIVAFYLKGIESLQEGMYCACMRVEGQKLCHIASPSLPEDFKTLVNGIPISENAGSFGAAAYLGQKVIVADVHTDALWKDNCHLLEPYGIQASWAYPLIGSNQKVIGVIAAFYKEVKAPTQEEEETLESIRNVLQLIIENKLAEAALKQSHERYLLATSATNDAVYDWDIAQDILYWGTGFENIFGVKRTRENADLASWLSMVHPEDKDTILTSLLHSLNYTSQDYWQEEYRIIRPDQSVMYVHERGFIVRDENHEAVRMVGAIQDITRHKKSKEELRRLSVIASETVNGIVIMRPDLSIEWINAAFTKMMGYTLEEVIGKVPCNFLSGPETDPETLAYIVKEVASLQTLECEIIHYSKAGDKYWIKLQVQPLLDEQGKAESLFALLTDITKQKEEEQQLRLLVSVITNARDAIIISRVDPEEPHQLESIFFNKSFYKMTGYQEQEVWGKEPAAFLCGPGTDPEASKKIKNCMHSRDTCEVELEIYRKDKSLMWVHVLLMPMLNHKDQVTHWISMIRDIRVRKQYERERELLIAELTQNNADLKQFTFITSHNLRSPLANLTGIANLINMNDIPEGRNKILIQKFKEATEQLNTVIDDLLEVLVIKDNPHTDKVKINLQEAFEKVVLSVERFITENNVQLTVDFSQVPFVRFNAGYLHSILLNLLTNAIKYRSPKRQLKIEVKTELKGKKAVLYFSDNGLGIDMKRYGERIFGLYQRFHDNKDSKGLGLYIAHSQAKAMGGNLRVVSEVDKGSTFILEF